MSVPIQTYKGVRDFYPEDQALQSYIFNIWRKVAVRYGYEECGASVLEYLDLYKLKHQDNQEILNEQIYSFVDRGGRQTALRPEMTPTIARLIAARRQHLSYPLRWYSLPNILRYERPQRGRLREHWQLNLDLFGLEGVEAELELILIIKDILNDFGAGPETYHIRLSSRDFLEFVLKKYFSLSDSQSQALIALLDRQAKIEPANFKAKVRQIVDLKEGSFEDFFAELKNLLETRQIDSLPEKLKESEACLALKNLISALRQAGVSNLSLDLSLVRGFNYYTGIVFEVFDLHPDNRRSLVGGGRYDTLLNAFGVDPLSAVGFGMGDVALADFLTTHDLLPNIKSSISIYLILLEDLSYLKGDEIAGELRKEGLNVFIDSREIAAGKKVESALKRGVDHVLFVGQDDLQDKKYNLKHLPSRQERRLKIEEIVKLLKNHAS